MSKNNLEKYYDNNRASKAIYGTVLLFVTIVGLHSLQAESAVTLGITTFVTALTIVFAEVYSEFIGARIKNKGKITKAEKHEIVNDCLAIATVSIWPSLLFFASSMGLYNVAIAFDLAYIYLLVVLFLFCYRAAKLSGATKVRAFLFAVINVSVGLVVITLKYLASH